MTTTKFKWTETITERLSELAGPEGSTVSQAQLASYCDEIDNDSARSVGAKLRNLGYTVQKASDASTTKKWSAKEETALTKFVNANANKLTYSEIAATFAGGKYAAKVIQGKILNLELYAKVRKSTPKATERTYTPEQEDQFAKMANSGAYLEDIAEALDKPINSVRGKALSMSRLGDIDGIPAQKNKVESRSTHFLDSVDGDLEDLTVEDIAEQVGKTVRGVKGVLSRRGIDCANYKGSAKRAKIDADAEAEEAA